MEVLVDATRSDLPTTDVHRFRRIRYVNDVNGPSAVVDRIDEIALDPDVVHAGGQVFGEGRKNLRMGGLTDVEDHDTVAPIARRLSRDNCYRRLLVHFHVVHDARIDHHRVRQRWRHRIRDVPDKHALPAASRVRARVCVIAAVQSLKYPEVARLYVRHRTAPDDPRFLLDAACGRGDSDRGRPTASRSDQPVVTRPLKHIRTIFVSCRAAL